MATQNEMGRVDAVEALSAFSRLEMEISRFYERLAEMFDDEPEVSEFWLRLSGEEIEHADALRSAAEMLPLLCAQPWSHGPFVERRVIDKLQRVIKACEALMTRRERSLDAAFSCALYLETSELNDIYQWLLNQVPLVWTDTLSSMNDEPAAHILSLCRAIERYGRDSKLHARAQVLWHQWEEYTMR